MQLVGMQKAWLDLVWFGALNGQEIIVDLEGQLDYDKFSIHCLFRSSESISSLVQLLRLSTS